jgi:ATP-binding cassette subfamily A (ABC1) protein 3
VRRLVEWSFYTENTLKCLTKITQNFENVAIVEFWDNIFKLKIKKENSKNSIGFLFGQIENQKQDCFLSEYSISQTSLEQIFNIFASENNEEVLNNSQKEIKISSNFINSILN